MADADDMPEVSASEAIDLVAAGTVLVDVREQDEWNAGYAPGATLLALSELQERFGELPTGSRLLVVCQAGMRSLRATTFLRGHGFDAVNVAGGMIAWSAAGGALSANRSDA